MGWANQDGWKTCHPVNRERPEEIVLRRRVARERSKKFRQKPKSKPNGLPPTLRHAQQSLDQFCENNSLTLRINGGGAHWQILKGGRIVAEWWPKGGRIIIAKQYHEPKIKTNSAATVRMYVARYLGIEENFNAFRVQPGTQKQKEPGENRTAGFTGQEPTSSPANGSVHPSLGHWGSNAGDDCNTVRYTRLPADYGDSVPTLETTGIKCPALTEPCQQATDFPLNGSANLRN